MADPHRLTPHRERPRTAVFPLAGRGTRLLPLTRAVPKELVALGTRPMLEYSLLEAVDAGFERIVLVLGPGKEAIAAHVSAAAASPAETPPFDVVAEVLQRAEVITVMQPDSRGLGSAVLAAQPAVGDSPFAVVLADDILVGPRPALLDLVDGYTLGADACAWVSVEDVPLKDTYRYGICQGTWLSADKMDVLSLVEKPNRNMNVGNTAMVGRYVLPPDVFSILARTTPGVDGEVQLTDALAHLVKESRLCALRVRGRRLDAGTMPGLVESTAWLLTNPPWPWRLGGDHGLR